MTQNGHSHAPVVILDEFLVREENAALIHYTLQNAGRFSDTRVIGHAGESRLDLDYRRSRVLFELDWFRDLLVYQILTFLPHVIGRLAMEWSPIADVEVQLTATNNNEFFRVHTDSDLETVRSRWLTFVYFFHREPRGFSGGQLRVFDTAFRDGNAVATGPYRLIEPAQNQIVFFPANHLHEILPVQVPSSDFADSRFTVNGWLHR